MREFIDWLLDQLWLFYVAGALLLGVLVYYGQRQLTKRCNGVMALARTPRDSLDAQIACEKMQSDAATAAAIGSAGYRSGR